MKEEEKYYTPGIEEFHVGFEFEIEDLHDNLVDRTFRPIIADWQELNEVYDNYEHEHQDFHKNYRVKYLDKEDIESLGFKEMKDISYNKEVYHFTGHNLMIMHYPPKNVIAIEVRDRSLSEILSVFDRSSLFFGVIKSKNQFKQLLQMLNIE
tara:strand:- start:1361 stop:1816 length:456 start_codon:yes stop_codon:yes gene_type:complete